MESWLQCPGPVVRQNVVEVGRKTKLFTSWKSASKVGQRGRIQGHNVPFKGKSPTT